MPNLRVGDIVVFKGGGFLYNVLSRILKLFEPDWDKWGWHTGFVYAIRDGTVYIAEALARGVCINPLLNDREFRVYRWLEVEPDMRKVAEFVNHHYGDRYDPICYFWTFIQRALYSMFKWQLFRIYNDRFTCWEFLDLFCTVLGKPWTMMSPLLFPLITDFLNQKPTQVL